MGRKTGRDRRVRETGDTRLQRMLEGGPRERDIFAGVSIPSDGPVRTLRSPRPIDKWPISKDVFAGLARDRVAGQQDVRRATSNAVARLATSWASPSAANHAREIAKHWGADDYRAKTPDSISWQLFYELQDQRQHPLPADTIPALSEGLQAACETLGLDYAVLNSVLARSALHETQDPFFVPKPVSDRSW